MQSGKFGEFLENANGGWGRNRYVDSKSESIYRVRVLKVNMLNFL